MKRFIVIFFLFISTATSAQLLDSSSVENGKQVCFHKMQQGETLFALSRQYKIGYSVIKAANPEKGDEIALGEIIKLPCDLIVKNSDKSISQPTKTERKEQEKLGETAPLNLPPNQDNDTIPEREGFVAHKVLAKETVYSLTKQYDCSIETFLLDNPQVKVEGLKEGMFVFFKDKTAAAVDNKAVIKSQTEEALTVIKEKVVYSKEIDSDAYRIGVLLPFMFEQNKKHLGDVKPGKEPELLPQTKLFLEFYQGFSMALDSLAQLGIKTQVFYFDSEADSATIMRIAELPEFKALNAIVGPAYDNQFMLLSSLVKDRDVKIISPFGRTKAMLINNPKAVKIQPSEEARIPILAQYLHKHYRDSNLILTYNDETDRRLIETLQAEILSISLMKDSIIMKTPVVVKGIYEPLAKLVLNSKNIIVSLSKDESFATKLVGKLQSRNADYDLTVFGVEEWKDFKNIEILYWRALNIHIVGNLDYRYSGIYNESFFKSYYKRYYTEPTFQSVLAYDIAFNFFNCIEGKKLNYAKIMGVKTQGYLCEYLFKYSNSDMGIENKAANVYKFTDFHFHKVNE